MNIPLLVKALRRGIRRNGLIGVKQKQALERNIKSFLLINVGYYQTKVLNRISGSGVKVMLTVQVSSLNEVVSDFEGHFN